MTKTYRAGVEAYRDNRAGAAGATANPLMDRYASE